MSYSASPNSIESLASPFASGTISSSNSNIYNDLVSKSWLSYNNATNTIESSEDVISFACLTSTESDNQGVGSFYTTNTGSHFRGSVSTGNASTNTNYGTRARSDDIAIHVGTSHKTQYFATLQWSSTIDKTKSVTYYIRLK